MRRGEVRWYTFALPDKRRPVLILSRDLVLPSLNEVIVVPATRTIRGIETEVVLTEDDGMPTACALLDSGVPVDELDDGDETALHGAAAFGHTEVVRLLLVVAPQAFDFSNLEILANRARTRSHRTNRRPREQPRQQDRAG